MSGEKLYSFDMKDTRTREERIFEHQLNRLRYWLALPSWCLEEKTPDIRIYSEGVWLLAGIDPEETDWGRHERRVFIGDLSFYQKGENLLVGKKNRKMPSRQVILKPVFGKLWNIQTGL